MSIRVGYIIGMSTKMLKILGESILKSSQKIKNFIISYSVGQSHNEQIPHIVVKGLEFGGLEDDCRQGWVRVQTPFWNDCVITPSLVKTIIEWCLSKKDQLMLVDWKGNRLN